MIGDDSVHPGQTQPAPIPATGQAATEAQPTASQPTDVPVVSVDIVPISAPAATALPSPVATSLAAGPAVPTPFFEPAGCQAPLHDYTLNP